MSEALNLSNSPETKPFAQEMVDFYDLYLEMTRRFQAERADQNAEDLAEFARYYAHEDAPKSQWEAFDESVAATGNWKLAFVALNGTQEPAKTFAKIADELDEVRKPFYLEHSDDKEAKEVDRYDTTKEADLYEEIAQKLALSGLNDNGIMTSLEHFGKKMEIDGEQLLDILSEILKIRDEAEIAEQVMDQQIDTFINSIEVKEFLDNFKQSITEYIKENGNTNGFFSTNEQQSPIHERITNEAARLINEFTKGEEHLRGIFSKSLNDYAQEIYDEQIHILTESGVEPKEKTVETSKDKTDTERRAALVAEARAGILNDMNKLREKSSKKFEDLAYFTVHYRDEAKRFRKSQGRGRKADFDRTVMGEAYNKEITNAIARSLGIDDENFEGREQELNNTVTRTMKNIKKGTGKRSILKLGRRR